jgi:cytochrome P450
MSETDVSASDAGGGATEAPGNAYHAPPAQIASVPTGCPVEHAWSPLSDDYLADPYPIAARLREDHPVFYAEQLGHVVVTRMSDIDEVFMHPDTFASANVQDPIWPLAPAALAVLGAPDFDPVAVMSNRAEPDHGRIRTYTRPGFGNRRLKTLEDYMRRRADELIDGMLDAGSPAEYVASFAFPLLAEIVFRFIGFPPEDDAMIKSWCVNRKAFSWGRPTESEQVEIAEGMLDYWRYCREFVAERRARRQDDFASELLDAHDADPGPDRDPAATTGISYREVESVVYGLSFAGHDPVTALLCNTLRCLLPRRDQWQALVDDPTLAANAVEETLRYESSQIGWRRITTRPTELGGVQLPAGTRIYLNFAAANRSPELFDQPETFDIRRDNANRHISFGKGIHFCLGSGLARMEARIALELLSRRIPSLRLVDGQELTFFPNITFRGPDTLWLEWD